MRKLNFIAIALAGAVACRDTAGPDRVVAQVDLSPSDVLIGPSETATLSAVARSAIGNVLPGYAVTWTSSDDLVATVANTGIVTGQAFGDATITATIEGKSAQATITVTATQPAHIAGAWRMQSFDGKAVPATYAFFPDAPIDGGIVDVNIRLDSAKMTLRSDGVYSSRQYCFTELHDDVPRFRYCWGDHGRFSLGNPAGRIAFVSEYIENLSASGTVTKGGLSLTEPLEIGEPPRSTLWTTSPQ